MSINELIVVADLCESEEDGRYWYPRAGTGWTGGIPVVLESVARLALDERDAEITRLRAELERAQEDAARWRTLCDQHEIDDDAASHGNYGRTYPKRTITVFEDDGHDGLEPVPCDPGALAERIDAIRAARTQENAK